ncbi:Protein FATTY ACID EXPORT 4 chloroplastic [Melia azedarach]|uniref:Protein FATTY ACID EXPORT 4 chloroplastic n=2 Tax=Melia azedarach TaxID=155640 RepID=A0ACC1XLD0_MELAZ|nr:Protein FATTY ACID EXPORT 4 chloroplastic [Melia azedarach]KAJ4711738.1 Protein FATTY ACID EXPORT 4 chloroplastic [Melia azedarach]
MFFCSVLIPAPASVCTKFSASNAYHNNIDKKEKRDRVTCFSFGISGAACSRNGKFNFRPRRRLCCKSQLGLAELAPASSAAYGILLLGGGLFAFRKSGSEGSLFGGLTGAALMASAYFLMQSPDTKAIGDALGFGSAFLFSSVFGIRLAATRKLIPAGPLLGLSICALAVFISAYLQDTL